MNYEMPDFADGKKWVDIELGHNGTSYGYRVYGCPQYDFMFSNAGYESEDSAYEAAVRQLNKLYGKDGWVA